MSDGGDLPEASPFSTLSYYRALYKPLTPELGFRTTDQASGAGWRERLRGKLVELLGGFPSQRVPLNPATHDRVEEAAFTRERVVFDTEEGVSLPAYLLLPRGQRGTRRAVLCLHGHGRGKDDVVGLVGSAKERQRHIRPLNYDYARQFVERGFVVLAPDARVFGERGQDGLDCTWAMTAGLLLGKVLVGMRVWDAIRVIDHLQTRPEVAPRRLACVGLSWGGTHTMYTAALDERVRVAVISGAFDSFTDMLIEARCCPCQYVPNLPRYAELTDIVNLITPRPLFIENGTEAPLYTLETAREEFRGVQRAYDLLDAPDQVRFHLFTAQHRFSGPPALDWVDAHL